MQNEVFRRVLKQVNTYRALPKFTPKRWEHFGIFQKVIICMRGCSMALYWQYLKLIFDTV